MLTFDTSSIESVLGDFLKLNTKGIVLIKSTIPVGYTEKIKKNSSILKI